MYGGVVSEEFQQALSIPEVYVRNPVWNRNQTKTLPPGTTSKQPSWAALLGHAIQCADVEGETKKRA